MKKLLAYIACFILGSLPLTSVFAQKSRSQLQTEINTNWPDNTTGAITPALLRSTVSDFLDSIVPASPCVSNVLGFDNSGVNPVCATTATLSSAIATTLSSVSVVTSLETASSISFFAVAGNGLNDRTAVAASSPTFWTNLGPAVTHRVNRLMVGVDSTAGSQTPPSPPDWMESLVPCTTSCANIASVSQLGSSAIVGAARTSDELAVFGTSSGGSAGSYLFGYNDDVTSTTPGPIALGAQLTGIVKTGNKGITLGAQLDVEVNASTCVPTPFTIECTIGTPSAIGALVTSGAFGPTVATQKATEAIAIGSSPLPFNAGIVFATGSVATGVGPSGTTVGIAMPVNYSIIWYTSSLGGAAAMNVDSAGNILLTTAGNGVLKFNGTAITVP